MTRSGKSRNDQNDQIREAWTRKDKPREAWTRKDKPREA